MNAADRQALLDAATPQTLAAILEELAEEFRWLKLRDSTGMVRAITLPRNHPMRSFVSHETHRDLMAGRVVSRGRMELAA